MMRQRTLYMFVFLKYVYLEISLFSFEISFLVQISLVSSKSEHAGGVMHSVYIVLQDLGPSKTDMLFVLPRQPKVHPMGEPQGQELLQLRIRLRTDAT
jgi:hypothetical protein